MNHGANGSVDLHKFSGYGQRITDSKQGIVGSPGFLAIYPDSGNLNI